MKPGELRMDTFEEWGHWFVERMTQEGKNFEMKKGVYQFRGFILEDEGEGRSCKYEDSPRRGNLRLGGPP